MSAHLMGYYDHLIQIIALVCIFLIAQERYLFAAFIQVIAMLIHESYLLVGFPVVVFSAFLILSSKKKAVTRELIGKQLILVLLPIIMIIGLMIYQKSIDQVSLFETLKQDLTRYGFVERNRDLIVAEAFTTDFRHYFITESPNFIYRLIAPRYMTTVVPFLLILIVYLRKQFDLSYLSIEFLFILGAIVSPLLLHLVAWDTGRIWMYPIFNGFLVIVLYSEIKGGKSSVPDDYVWLAFTIIMIMNIFTSTPLMDKLFERIPTLHRILLYFPMIYLFFSQKSTHAKD
jgi:hypothetical protein